MQDAEHPDVWPHAWANRHVKFSTLEYVSRILGRLEDDNGTLMRIRQMLARENASLTSMIDKDEPGFVVAPLPKWVAEAMLKIIWHGSFDIAVGERVSDWDLREKAQQVRKNSQ